MKNDNTLDIKRFYLPGTRITSTCPKCGASIVKDLGSDYLSYPRIGEDTAAFYCYENPTTGELCGTSWDVRIRLVVRLEAVSGCTVEEGA